MNKLPAKRVPHRRTARNTKTAPDPKAPQLRGNSLKARIGEAVREYAREMEDRIDPQRISMKAIAKRVPCSRTSLQKYEAVVADALRDLGYRAARRTGEARAEALAHRAELYKQEVGELRAELAALRAHHADLYGRLLMASAPMAALARDDVIAASQRNGRCVLCGGVPPSDEPINVVDIPAPRTRQWNRKK